MQAHASQVPGDVSENALWKPGSASHLSRQSCQAPVDTTWQKHSIKTFAQVVSARNVRQNFLKGEGSCSALVQCLGDVQYQVCVQPFSLVGLQCSTPASDTPLLQRLPHESYKSMPMLQSSNAAVSEKSHFGLDPELVPPRSCHQCRLSAGRSPSTPRPPT